MSLNTVNTQLMKAFDFTPDDLAANRTGSLTAAQRETLKALVSGGSRVALVIALIVVLIMVGVCVYVLLGSQGIIAVPPALSGSKVPLILGVMALIIVIYVFMLVRSLMLSRQMRSGEAKVQMLTGKIKVRTQRARGPSAAGAATPSYVVQLGKEKIYTTNQRVTKAFRDGVTYRVYVVGRQPGYIIVSAEVMQAG